jgi:hypothetical protein
LQKNFFFELSIKALGIKMLFFHFMTIWLKKVKNSYFFTLKKKNNICGFSTMVQNPLKIQEKNSKKFFFGYLTGTKSPFLRPKNFPNFFWLHLVPGTTIEKKIKKHR